MAANLENVLICSGQNSSHQLGVPSDSASSNGHEIVQMPAALSLSSKGLLSISAGLRHSVLIYDDGKVFAIGDDRNDQIGCHKQDIFEIPTEIHLFPELTDEKIIQAACGQYYTAYLTNKGSIYISGWRNPGNQYKVDVIENNENIKFVYIQAGFDAPVAIDSNGNLFIFDSYYSTKPPVKYHGEFPFYDVARGSGFIIAVDTNGSLYGSGKVIGQKGEMSDLSTHFEKISHIDNLKASRVFANYQTAAVLDSTSNRVYLMNSQNKFEVCESLNDKKVVNLDVGSFYALFIVENGELYSLGSNLYAELMLGRTDEKPQSLTQGPFQKPKLNYVKCGTHHSFAIVNGASLPHFGAKAFNVQ